MNLTNEKFWREGPTFLKKKEEFVEKIVYVYPRAVVVGLCQTLHEKCESITQTRKQKLLKLKRKMMTSLNHQRGWLRHPISARAVTLKRDWKTYKV